MAAKQNAEAQQDEVLETKSTKKKEEQVTIDPVEYLNELVPYTAFYDGEKYKEPIFVAVNGKGFMIERGVEVMIPRYVKQVLDQGASQDKHAASYSRKAAEEFAAATKQLGY